MLKLEYTNERNQSWTFGVGVPDCLLTTWSGLSAAEVSAQTLSGFDQHGVCYYGSLLQPRTIAVSVVLVRESAQSLAQARQRMLSVFNPLLKGVLYIAPLGEAFTHAVDCVVIEPPTMKNAGSNHFQMFDLSFYVPSGVIRSANKHDIRMEGFVGGLKWPLRFPIRFAQRGNVQRIDYAGHLPAPLTVSFLGPARDPRVNNITSGKYIQLDVELRENERIVVDNDPAGPKVYLEYNGAVTPAFHRIDPDCDLGDFDLALGINDLNYVAGAGNPVAGLCWHDLYTGV